MAVRSKVKGINCGCARREKLACSVFHVFSRVEACSEVKLSPLCELLFLPLLMLSSLIAV